MTFSNRRRFLERCGLIGFGAAAGWLAPAWLGEPERAAAEGQGAATPEEQLKKLGLKLPTIEPSGATAGPSVSPPAIGAERVKSNSSLASGSTILSPVGLGTSAARREEETARERKVTIRMRMVVPLHFSGE